MSDSVPPRRKRLMSARGVVTGAVVGAVIAGVFSLMTSWFAIQQQASVTQGQFVRTERLSEYSKVIQHNTELLTSERFLLEALDAKTIDRGRLKKDLAAIPPGIAALRLDFFSVELLGSKPAVAATSGLLGVHEDFYDKAKRSVSDLVDSPLGTNLSIGHTEEYNEKTVPTLARYVQQFIDSARADLGG